MAITVCVDWDPEVIAKEFDADSMVPLSFLPSFLFFFAFLVSFLFVIFNFSFIQAVHMDKSVQEHTETGQKANLNLRVLVWLLYLMNYC